MLVLHARYLERRSLLARSKEFRVVRNALKDRGFPVTVRAECRLAEATQLSSASLSQASAPLTITVSGDAFHRGCTPASLLWQIPSVRPFASAFLGGSVPSPARATPCLAGAGRSSCQRRQWH